MSLSNTGWCKSPPPPSFDKEIALTPSLFSPHIRALMRPLDSVMDDSIACALWFAARGQGELLSSGGANQAYTAAAKVLLLGMGADEQLAGYGRHRCRFNDGGWDALHAEVALDLGRISSRNLGRDDRFVMFFFF